MKMISTVCPPAGQVRSDLSRQVRVICCFDGSRPPASILFQIGTFSILILDLGFHSLPSSTLHGTRTTRALLGAALRRPPNPRRWPPLRSPEQPVCLSGSGGFRHRGVTCARRLAISGEPPTRASPVPPAAPPLRHSRHSRLHCLRLFIGCLSFVPQICVRVHCWPQKMLRSALQYSKRRCRADRVSRSRRAQSSKSGVATHCSSTLCQPFQVQ